VRHVMHHIILGWGWGGGCCLGGGDEREGRGRRMTSGGGRSEPEVGKTEESP